MLVNILLISLIVILYKTIKYSYDNVKPDNYCTGFFDGSWGGCCYNHDASCLLAIEYLSREMRLEADTELFRCVSKKNWFIAIIMYLGVRAWANSFWYIGYWREWREQRQTA